ncbi:MAG: discoidin domain-containing protein [Eubacteriales bacterium]
MRKKASAVICAAILTAAFTALGIPSSAATLCNSWSGEALNCGEAVGGNTGGSAYVDKDGGYRTLIHEVNTGVRPIKNFVTDDIAPDGRDLYIRYKVKVLSDDNSTADNTKVFGFYQHIYGDGVPINDESGDSLIFTAKDVRSFSYDSDGWAYVYYIVSEERFSISSYSAISINNQVYYNGAKNSGCTIDLAIAEIAVFAGNPEEGIDPPAPETGEGDPIVEDWTSVEISEFPVAGTANLSGYSFATSDSYKDQGTIAVTAVDGDILSGSRWVSTVSVKKDEASGLYVNSLKKTAWLRLEFEIPTKIDCARIYWATECAAVGGYKLYYSDDGEQWTPITFTAFNRSEGNGSESKPYVDTILFDSICARYVKLEISVGMTSAGLGSVYEFELYGDPAQYAYLSRLNSDTATQSDGADLSAVAAGSIGGTNGSDTDSGLSSDAVRMIASAALLIAAVAGIAFAFRKLPNGRKKTAAWTGALSVALCGSILLTSVSCTTKSNGGESTDSSSSGDTTASAPSDTVTSATPEDTDAPDTDQIPVSSEETVRDGWLLTNVPSYEGGQLASALYNAGPGLASDSVSTTDEDSHMQIVYRTTADEFESYLTKLESLGYQQVMKNTLDSNIHAEYMGGGKLIYAYFTATTKVARIIDDCSSVSVEQFGYTCQSNGTSTVYQYGLYQAGNTNTTMDCGMLYVIRLADNSLFIVDGGHQFQATDEAAQGFMDFLHEITGTTSDQRVNISCWFITHAHADHIMMAAKVLHRYHNEINLDRVFFNFPSFRVATSGYRAFVTTWFKHIVTTYYDNAVFMKPHTGMNFNLADVNIQVLFTHEDAIAYNNASVWPISDFNSSSTVLKFTIDGQTFLMLGDTTSEAETYMLRMYKDTTVFKSDLLQVAHHSFNYLSKLYPLVEPTITLIPNSYANAHSSENLPKIQVLIDTCGADNLYYEGNGTNGFSVVDGKWTMTYEKELIGGPYDGSGF